MFCAPGSFPLLRSCEKALSFLPHCSVKTVFERCWMRKSINSICCHLRVTGQRLEIGFLKSGGSGQCPLPLEAGSVLLPNTVCPQPLRWHIPLWALGRQCFAWLLRGLAPGLNLGSFNGYLCSWGHLHGHELIQELELERSAKIIFFTLPCLNQV